MIVINKLKAAMTEAGYSVKEAAKAIGMPPSTMYLKLKKGVFTTDEVDLMVRAYRIREPEKIFRLGVIK